jgi:spoIIIJ-associated protein
MSKCYEYQGKSVDHALEKASEELNIPAGKIKHEVLAYGSSGIFGLVGVKKAIVKVFVENDNAKKNPLKPDIKQSAKNLAEQDFVNTETTKSVKTLENGNDNSQIQSSPRQAAGHAFGIAVHTGVESLQKVVDHITDGATVIPVHEKDKLIFNVSGGDSGVLIGKRGQTLEAIQYLLEKMVNKNSANRVRVLVDVEGYLEKRKNSLQAMASRLAEKARRTRKPVAMGQMNAHDRRIVHIQLKDEHGVRSQSIGDGYYRKLMILPKKMGALNRDSTDNKS